MKEESKRIKKTEELLVSLDNNDTFGDINLLSWKDNKLTPKEKLFIFYYCYPFNNSAYRNISESARRAGYAKKNARIQGHLLLHKEKIINEVKNFTNDFTKLNIQDAFYKIIKLKMISATIDPCLLYETKTIKTENGSFEAQMPKNLNEIPAEIRKACIKGIKYESSRGLVNLDLVDKEKAQNDIIKLYNEQNEIVKVQDDFNVETTAEIIKGELKLRTAIIKNNSDIAKEVEYKKSAKINNDFSNEALEED